MRQDICVAIALRNISLIEIRDRPVRVLQLERNLEGFFGLLVLIILAKLTLLSSDRLVPFTILGLKVPDSIVVMVMVLVLPQTAIPVNVIFRSYRLSESLECVVHDFMHLPLRNLVVRPLLNCDRVSSVERMQ